MEAVEEIFAEVFTKVVLQELTTACNAAAEETKRKASETGSTVGTIDLAIFFQGLEKFLEEFL